jgi:hypothetical protein
MVMGLDEAGPPAEPAADPVAAELQAATVVTASTVVTANTVPAARAVSL